MLSIIMSPLIDLRCWLCKNQNFSREKLQQEEKSQHKIFCTRAFDGKHTKIWWEKWTVWVSFFFLFPNQFFFFKFGRFQYSINIFFQDSAHIYKCSQNSAWTILFYTFIMLLIVHDAFFPGMVLWCGKLLHVRNLLKVWVVMTFYI